MLKKSFYLLPVMLLAVLGAGPAMALSIGATFNAGTGESKLYKDHETIHVDHGYTPSIGGGLVINDENTDGTYIHRYSITLDRYSIIKGSRQDLYRFNFINTFCFVLSHNDYYQFWLGPQVGIRYIFGRTSFNPFDNNPELYIPPLLVYANPEMILPYLSKIYGKAKYNMAGLDLGIVAGLNVNIKKYVTLSASGGLRYGATVGGMSFRHGGLFQNNYLVFSHGYEAFLDFSILYRFDPNLSDKQAG